MRASVDGFTNLTCTDGRHGLKTHEQSTETVASLFFYSKNTTNSPEAYHFIHGRIRKVKHSEGCAVVNKIVGV